MKKSSNVVTQFILDSIMKGEVPSGGKIPSTENLAKINHTSIISAREAVQNLASIGILEINHGRGIFLTNGQPIIEDLLVARMIIESKVVEMATAKLGPADIKEVENLIQSMENSVNNNDVESFTDYDYEFHILISKFAGNRILSKTLENIKDLLHYQQSVINRFNPSIIQKSLGRHREIFGAMKLGKSDKASSIMVKHIREVLDSWKSM